MSKPSRLIAGVTLLAIGVAAGVYLDAPATAQEKQKQKAVAVTQWEYRIVTLNEDGARSAEQELTKLGEEGFEISFVTGTHKSRAAKFGGFGKREQQPVAATSEASPVVYYTLKRAKQ